MKVLKTIFLALVIFFLSGIVNLVAYASEESTGRAIIVDDDGDGDYKTINEGIAAAEPGDTVVVRGGVYYESINIYKSSITLKGTSDPNGQSIPIIGSTGASSPIISVYRNSCVIQGFKIMGDKSRKAIEVKGNDNIIEKNTILNSYVGIVVWSSGNVISGNSIGLDTVGVQVYDSFNIIENNNFWGDRECIYTSQAFNLDISDNVFAGYQTGISINFYSPTESYCTITDNNFLEPDNVLSNLFGIGIKSATFYNCLSANWRHNYWGLPRFFIPKVIIGTIKNGNTEYQWINIDWAPAMFPSRNVSS